MQLSTRPHWDLRGWECSTFWGPREQHIQSTCSQIAPHTVCMLAYSQPKNFALAGMDHGPSTCLMLALHAGP